MWILQKCRMVHQFRKVCRVVWEININIYWEYIILT